MSDIKLICPQCGSEDIESTCIGGNIIGSDPDCNRVNCNNCKHKGTAQDWKDLYKITTDYNLLRESTVSFMKSYQEYRNEVKELLNIIRK